MTPFPLGLDAPGKRLTTSTRLNRDPSRLIAIVAEHLFRGAFGHVVEGKPTGRYMPHNRDGRPGDETACNLFAQDVCEAMGVTLPRNTRANELVKWLASPVAASFDWETLDAPDDETHDAAHLAQRMADEGQLVLVGWVNPAGPGHIAVVVPSLDEPGLWIAQAGSRNFTRGTLAQGFGGRSVHLFAHP